MITNKKKIVASLNKEFRKLEKGKTVQIKFNLTQNIDIPIKVFWEESDYSNFSWDEKLIDKYRDHVFWEIEESVMNESSNYTKEIRKFIDKCDDFADQFGQDKTSFWDEVYSFGAAKQRKAYEKKTVKKRIADLEKELAQLKQRI